MEYICWACGNKHKIQAEYPQQVMPIRDINGNWFCPSCYKEYGKPDISEVLKLINKAGTQPPSFSSSEERKQHVNVGGVQPPS